VPPPKKVPQTDAIFEQVKQVNERADAAGDTLRLSLDAKATVNVGPFSRRGRSRTKTKGADHDFKPEATLTPFGIFSPEHDDLTLYMARSKVTSDFIVDRLEDWWEFNEVRFPGVTRVVLNLDNGLSIERVNGRRDRLTLVAGLAATRLLGGRPWGLSLDVERPGGGWLGGVRGVPVVPVPRGRRSAA